MNSLVDMLMVSNKLLLLFIALLSLTLSGCATYGSGLDGALDAAKSGDYVSAESKLKTAITPVGVDRLLYYMELAVLKHLQGQYLESNQLLEKADIIAERLETTSVTNSLAAFMINPRQGDYVGADFEKVFINYYKALNYIALSASSKNRNEYLDAIESARVESRRLGIRLNALNSDKGNYTDLKDDDATLSTLLDIFYSLRRDLIDSRQLEYRDDAMAHYLTGITFEANKEYDNARISYQKAATSYEDGFAKQFRLGDSMTKQAWFDVVRVMRLSGNYENEWPRLAKKKLSKQEIDQLKGYDNKSQLVIIEHVGLVPQREEMNIELRANPYTRSLELRPYVISSSGQPLDMLAWFYLVYADKSLLDMAINYYDASFHGFNLNGFTKTIFLGPVWKSIEETGLLNAIGQGLRITVPYYAPPKNKPGESFALVDGRRFALNPASNPAIMGINEQILNASSDIELALTRGAFKALTAQRTAELAGGDFGSILAGVGRLASQLSDAAETRNWLMLPFEIRVTRIPLEAGNHDIVINSAVNKSKPTVKQQQKVVLQENEIKVVQIRSMENLNKSTVLSDSLEASTASKPVAVITQ